jgi:hypothetical protein
MIDLWLQYLIASALASYITNTWLTITWKVYGNGRFK